VRLVIADTGPVNYLIQIGHIDVLPVLFNKVIFPSTVRDELTAAPALVRQWIAAPPPCIDVEAAARDFDRDPSPADLDAGEKNAIALAARFRADLLLMDDRQGVVIVRRKGLTVTGTLGILALAPRHHLLDLADAFDRLKQTNFRYRQDMMDELLAEAGGER
jgi:predicted nucleic acid-binding protein